MLVLHGKVGFKLTIIKKVQTKQNTVIMTIFSATTHGKDTESAFPLINVLNIPSVTSIFKFQALKFAHRWHSKALPNSFYNYFQYASDIHSYMIRDMLIIKIFISCAQGPTFKTICFFNRPFQKIP